MRCGREQRVRRCGKKGNEREKKNRGSLTVHESDIFLYHTKKEKRREEKRRERGGEKAARKKTRKRGEETDKVNEGFFFF